MGLISIPTQMRQTFTEWYRPATSTRAFHAPSQEHEENLNSRITGEGDCIRRSPTKLPEADNNHVGCAVLERRLHAADAQRGTPAAAGFSKGEMAEALMQTGGYAGFPAALSAISLAAQVWEQNAARAKTPLAKDSAHRQGGSRNCPLSLAPSLAVGG